VEAINHVKHNIRNAVEIIDKRTLIIYVIMTSSTYKNRANKSPSVCVFLLVFGILVNVRFTDDISNVRLDMSSVRYITKRTSAPIVFQFFICCLS